MLLFRILRAILKFQMRRPGKSRSILGQRPLKFEIFSDFRPIRLSCENDLGMEFTSILMPVRKDEAGAR